MRRLASVNVNGRDSVRASASVGLGAVASEALEMLDAELFRDVILPEQRLTVDQDYVSGSTICNGAVSSSSSFSASCHTVLDNQEDVPQSVQRR